VRTGLIAPQGERSSMHLTALRCLPIDPLLATHRALHLHAWALAEGVWNGLALPWIPPGTRLRGPSGSLRCSAWQGPAELGSASLRQAAVLFPANPALLARVNGEWCRACFAFGHCRATACRGRAVRDAGSGGILDAARSQHAV